MTAINELKTYIDTALKYGIDANGTVLSDDDTTPTYGGVETGEDFDGFGILTENSNETDDPRLMIGNNLIVKIEKYDGSITSTDNNESTSYRILVMVVTQYAFSVTENSVINTKADACDIILDRLRVFMKELNFHPFFIVSLGLTSQVSAAESQVNNTTKHIGYVTKAIEMFEEGY